MSNAPIGSGSLKKDVCRLCGLPADHVHVSEHLTAAINTFRKPPLRLKLWRISNIDFGVPAINYKGRWYRVPIALVDEVWPLIKSRITRSAAKQEIEDGANNDSVNDEDDV